MMPAIVTSTLTSWLLVTWAKAAAIESGSATS